MCLRCCSCFAGDDSESRSLLNADHQNSRSPKASSLAGLFLFRIMRRWNQSGQKYAGAADIANGWLPQHPVILWLLVFITLADLSHNFLETSFSSTRIAWTISSFASIFIPASILLFKIKFTVNDAPELLGQALPSARTIVNYTPNLTNLARFVLLGPTLYTAFLVIMNTRRRENRFTHASSHRKKLLYNYPNKPANPLP